MITLYNTKHVLLYWKIASAANGVPIETVSQMMGHRSLSQTQHYAKVLDVKVSEDMNALRNRLSQIE